MTRAHECPVCGSTELSGAPYANWPPPVGVVLVPPYENQLGAPSYEVCPNCGFEFGNDDNPGTGEPQSFEKYRDEWTERGRPRFAAEWVRLMAISDSGLWLGIDRDEWVVGRRDRSPTRVADDARALLPILQRPWSEVGPELERLISDGAAPSPLPLDATLRLALSTVVSQHWTDRAVGWLRDGFPIDELPRELRHVCFDERTQQRTRQDAAKLIVDRADLNELLAEHREAPFPADVVRGQDYAEVEPVMVDADIFGWATGVASGDRVDRGAQLSGLARARGELQRSLGALPESSRPYFERLLLIALVALAHAARTDSSR